VVPSETRLSNQSTQRTKGACVLSQHTTVPSVKGTSYHLQGMPEQLRDEAVAGGVASDVGLRWATAVSDYKSGVISWDQRTVTCCGNNNRWLNNVSVRARHGFRSGRHSWRVKGTGGVDGIRVGIVTAGFSLWQEGCHAIGNDPQDDRAFGFYGGGTAFGKWKSGQHPPEFSSGDVMELTLDLGSGTLEAQNVTQGSAAVTVCTSLPRGEEFFPAASVYTKGNSVEILQGWASSQVKQRGVWNASTYSSFACAECKALEPAEVDGPSRRAYAPHHPSPTRHTHISSADPACLALAAHSSCS
jgi:hypothetical protein